MTDPRPFELVVLDEVMDKAVDIRVRLHRQKGDGLIGVDLYKDGLKAVRDVEDLLERLRRELGCEHSRAYERCVAERERLAVEAGEAAVPSSPPGATGRTGNRNGDGCTAARAALRPSKGPGE